MRFSIIIPTFNSERYLTKTLKSIANQQHNDVEVLVADGGSKDKTLEIANSYSFVRVVSTEDKGQTDGINRAYKHVTGDVVAWQNSDDVYLDGSFDKVLKAFEQSDIDVVYGNYSLVDEGGNLIRYCRSHPWDGRRFRTGRFVPLQPTVFWRRKVSDTVFPLNDKLYYTMDVDLFSKADQKGYRFLYLNEELGQFRVHTSGKTSKYSDTLKVLQEHAKTLQANYDLSFADKILMLKNLSRIFLIKLYLNYKHGKA